MTDKIIITAAKVEFDMNENKDVIKVLAVADPAVRAYTDTRLNLLGEFPYPVQFDVFPWDVYYKTMCDVFEGKEYYDVIMAAGHLWKRELVQNNNIVPINFNRNEIAESIGNEMYYNGNAYLSPSFCDGHMILFSKSIFEKENIHFSGMIIKPQEYIDAAEKLHKAGYTIPMKAAKSEIFTDALVFMRMYGKDVYDSETHEIQCDSEEVISGLEKYLSLREYAFENTYTFGNDEVAKALRDGTSPLGVTWSGQMGVVLDSGCKCRDDFGFATFDTAWNVTWSFAVTEKSTQKEKADRLLEFLRSRNVDKKAGAVSGAPVRVFNYISGMKDYPWYDCQLKMIQNAKPLPDIKNAGDKNACLYDEIYNAFIGRKMAAQAMKDAAAAIRNL
ncbi:MAG: hypothetical protein Q4F95_00350 [Oscillospiraceae bacterium]|nr:hypothetical protein [Oscillospiraceae bacterium]